MSTLTERTLLRELSGTVLEIGPGAGDYLDELPVGIDWIGLEPDESVLDELRRNASDFPATTTVVRGVAEHIPLDDDSVDEVVSRFVLCSVDDQRRSLDEIVRVLKPGGRFSFIEHVGGKRHSPLWFAQKLVSLPTARVAGACDSSRQTLAAIEATGFAALSVEHYSVAGSFGIRVPHIIGSARLGGS